MTFAFLENKEIPEFLYEPDLETARQNMIAVLLREEYGFYPNRESALSFRVVKEEPFAAGRAVLKEVNITATFPKGEFTFPMRAAIPVGKENVPFFVHINFYSDVPNKFQPTEEILDNGFAVLSFCHKDVTSDNWDFSDGVSPYILGADGQTNDTDCGKIAMWAWAASRVLDYAETIPELDQSHAIVVGHSRLGKTALLAGALDTRFCLAISNDSGCSGAAITRGKQGETVEDICKVIGYWFCKNYNKYRNNEDAMPFDQHFLVAAMAPRKVYVASAEEDLWADPMAEFCSCVLAGKFYEHYGRKGFVCNDKYPENAQPLHEGNVAYHVRSGAHYQSREDWKYYMEYAKQL